MLPKLLMNYFLVFTVEKRFIYFTITSTFKWQPGTTGLGAGALGPPGVLKSFLEGFGDLALASETHTPCLAPAEPPLPGH